MEGFIKKVLNGGGDADSHRYFTRFGKGDYKRRFLISLNKSNKIKVKASFELANDFVAWVNENRKIKFSGKVLTKEKVAGKEGRKKAGVFVYEVEECAVSEFVNVYYYLLDAEDSDIILKIKKSLPKPGKNEEKIDDGFCSLTADLKYWNSLKNMFFWDVPDSVKKAEIEHELRFKEMILPKDEKDPAKVRENALRKGTIVRKITADGKVTEKEIPVEA